MNLPPVEMSHHTLLLLVLGSKTNGAKVGTKYCVYQSEDFVVILDDSVSILLGENCSAALSILLDNSSLDKRILTCRFIFQSGLRHSCTCSCHENAGLIVE